ncbi:MAG: hypothetical protein KF699_08630 [Phycisphaeraceae bacterium]|nr:hypothetical protein [Phycisphaeraceae bacterium]
MTKWTYIDSVILRDRDIAASRKLSKGSLLPGRRGEVPERSEGDEGALFTLGRADVSAIFDNSGAVIEWQKYSAYGVPFLLTPGDHGKDGGISAADQTAFNADYAANNLRADLNKDGTISSADQTLFTASYNKGAVGGRWKLSAADVCNRKGYAGYEHEGFGNDLAAPEIAHVRHRVLHFGLGRWTRRDPLGYVDGMSVYAYLGARPMAGVDPSGLVPISCVGCATHRQIPSRGTSGPVPATPINTGISINECNQCAQAAQNDPANAAMIAEMAARGCPFSFPGCRNCPEHISPGLKGWAESDGSITLCANRMPSCQYAMAVFSHELLHAYDFCQDMIPENPSCCDCICYELRAYRWDGGCRDGGVRRTVPGPGGQPPPQSERDCLEMYVGASCNGEGYPCADVTLAERDQCFDSMYSAWNCNAHSVQPVFRPPTVTPMEQ